MQLKSAVSELATLIALAAQDSDPASQGERVKSLMTKGKAALALAEQYDKDTGSNIAGALVDFNTPSGGIEAVKIAVKDAIVKLGIEGELKPDAKDFFADVQLYGARRRRGRGKKTRKGKSKKRMTRRR